MYRIEVAPGEETVFRTIEELAVGIRNGVITSRSRVYHNASQKWLPIGLHPHYKKALELPTASAAQPAAPTPVPPGPRTTPRAASAPTIRAPVTSPVVAMQQEVLRDLPVVSIPDPLPRTREVPEPAARPSPPAAVKRTPPPHTVQAQPTATVTYTPRVTAEAARPHVPVEPPPEESLETRPTARRSPRAGGRPFLLLGAAAALVVAAHFALTATRGARAGAGAEPTDAAPVPASEMSSEEENYSDETDPPEPAPRVSSAPARVPMMPGPAFAGSAVRPGADASASGALLPGATAPAHAPNAASTLPAIAPPPAALDLSLPDLASDSLLPKPSGDTMAMKKILRALNGAKPPEATAVP